MNHTWTVPEFFLYSSCTVHFEAYVIFKKGSSFFEKAVVRTNVLKNLFFAYVMIFKKGLLFEDAVQVVCRTVLYHTTVCYSICIIYNYYVTHVVTTIQTTHK